MTFVAERRKRAALVILRGTPFGFAPRETTTTTTTTTTRWNDDASSNRRKDSRFLSFRGGGETSSSSGLRSIRSVRCWANRDERQEKKNLFFTSSATTSGRKEDERVHHHHHHHHHGRRRVLCLQTPTTRRRSVANGTSFAFRALADNDETLLSSTSTSALSSTGEDDEDEDEDEDDEDEDEEGGYNKTKHWNPTKHASNSLSNDDTNSGNNSSSSNSSSGSSSSSEQKEGAVEEGRGSRERPPKALESIEGNVFRDRERLKSDKDFDRVKKNGRALNYSCIRIKAAPNDGVPGATGCHRIGIVVPKKQLKRAVDRNLCKRRVRAIFRTNKDKWPKTESGSHLDFIVFVKQEALEGGFKQLEKEMFSFASDYTEREMKSKTSKARNAAKFARNNAARNARQRGNNSTAAAAATDDDADDDDGAKSKKENNDPSNVAR